MRETIAQFSIDNILFNDGCKKATRLIGDFIEEMKQVKTIDELGKKIERFCNNLLKKLEDAQIKISEVPHEVISVAPNNLPAVPQNEADLVEKAVSIFKESKRNIDNMVITEEAKSGNLDKFEEEIKNLCTKLMIMRADMNSLSFFAPNTDSGKS